MQNYNSNGYQPVRNRFQPRLTWERRGSPLKTHRITSMFTSDGNKDKISKDPSCSPHPASSLPAESSPAFQIQKPSRHNFPRATASHDVASFQLPVCSSTFVSLWLYLNKRVNDAEGSVWHLVCQSYHIFSKIQMWHLKFWYEDLSAPATSVATSSNFGKKNQGIKGTRV